MKTKVKIKKVEELPDKGAVSAKIEFEDGSETYVVLPIGTSNEELLRHIDSVASDRIRKHDRSKMPKEIDVEV